jgi:hypothetical protein
MEAMGYQQDATVQKWCHTTQCDSSRVLGVDLRGYAE